MMVWWMEIFTQKKRPSTTKFQYPEFTARYINRFHEMEEMPQRLLTEHPGEVAKLIQALASRMDKQGSAPYKSAEMAKVICEQYGIRLPVDFVKVPEYEQISLFGNAD